jgi:hypothetical protein
MYAGGDFQLPDFARVMPLATLWNIVEWLLSFTCGS